VTWREHLRPVAARRKAGPDGTNEVRQTGNACRGWTARIASIPPTLTMQAPPLRPAGPHNSTKQEPWRIPQRALPGWLVGYGEGYIVGKRRIPTERALKLGAAPARRGSMRRCGMPTKAIRTEADPD